MKARLKTEPQSVWQLTAAHFGVYDPLPPVWVRACTELLSDGLYLVRGPDKQRIERGDWLLQDLDGKPTWSTDADFRRQYEEVA